MAPTTHHLRWRRLLLSGLAGLVLLGVIAYVALNQAFPPERLAAMLSEQVRKTTGRDFAVRGALSIRLLPRIGVAADDVVLGNAPWGTRKDMLRVQHARFDIALWPLLQGLVEIARCVICIRDGAWPARDGDVEEVDVDKLKEMVHVKDEDIEALDKYVVGAGSKP